MMRLKRSNFRICSSKRNKGNYFIVETNKTAHILFCYKEIDQKQWITRTIEAFASIRFNKRYFFHIRPFGIDIKRYIVVFLFEFCVSLDMHINTFDDSKLSRFDFVPEQE